VSAVATPTGRWLMVCSFFFFQAEDGIRDWSVTGVQTCALPILSVRELLIQALLDAPMFTTRWRWNANRALAIVRRRGDRKIPPQLQRMESEDLLAAIFPDQVACGENIVGDREIPAHPLVAQTIRDCLEEAMDIDC